LFVSRCIRWGNPIVIDMAIRKNTGIEMSSCSGVSIEPKACSEFHVQIVLTVNREFTF
jgi:hypothetical protein